MPLVLKHTISGQIYTCMLVNNYRLPYYGTKYWDYLEEGQSQYAAFLSSQGIEDPESWVLLEVSENQLKLCNVKLKNDPRFSLQWDQEQGTLHVSTSPLKS